MLKDQEGNTINLSENPNGHLLVLGRSGAGKTYFYCRKIEAEIEKGKKLYIFDKNCILLWKLYPDIVYNVYRNTDTEICRQTAAGEGSIFRPPDGDRL